MRNAMRRFFEALLPWYSPEAADEHDRRTDAIVKRAGRVRLNAEQVRLDYVKAGNRAQRR